MKITPNISFSISFNSNKAEEYKDDGHLIYKRKEGRKDGRKEGRKEGREGGRRKEEEEESKEGMEEGHSREIHASVAEKRERGIQKKNRKNNSHEIIKCK